MMAALHAAFRAPLALHRAGLGRLLGPGMLVLGHTGRRSGAARETVLEIVDRLEDGGYVVVAGRGSSADWVRNLTRVPAARVTVRGRSIPARAEVLDADRTRSYLAALAERRPLRWRVMTGMLELVARVADPAAPVPEPAVVRLRPAPPG